MNTTPLQIKRLSPYQIVLHGTDGRVHAFDPLHLSSASTVPQEDGTCVLNVDLGTGKDLTWLCVRADTKEQADALAREVMDQHEIAVRLQREHHHIPAYMPQLVQFDKWFIDPLAIRWMHKNVIKPDKMSGHTVETFILNLNMTLGHGEQRSYAIDLGSAEELDRVVEMLQKAREQETVRQQSHYLKYRLE